MGESLVQFPTVENKMGESVAHVPCLQESVSFGRFEHDSLSWERWSTFPTNKYLEEVEKYSTPGSVAQKKAYFEAHYKKIAARKEAELLLDQEKKREAESANSDDQIPVGPVYDTSKEEFDVEKVKANTQNSICETDWQEDTVGNCDGEVSVLHIDVRSDGADIIKEGNEVSNLMSELITELNGRTRVFNEINEVAKFSREVNDHIAEPHLGADMIYEVEELVKNEVTEHTDEVDDCAENIYIAEELVKNEVTEHTDGVKDRADIIYEVVKNEVTEHVHKPNDGSDMIEGNENTHSQAGNSYEDLCPNMKIVEPQKTEELVLVKEDTACIQEWQDKEELPRVKVEQKAAEKEIENQVNLVNPKKMQKKTSDATNAKKKPSASTPKRSTVPLPKLPIVSTPKSSKPELTKTSAKSTTRPLVKKENGFTPLTSKKTTRPESKRVLPTSLHMSLSLGPVNSDSASLTARKSLIMESMGDKDIVKRAFKAFQNVPQLSSLAKPPATNQPAPGKAERRGSTPATLQKKNEGIGKAAKTAISHNGQQGMRKTSLSPGVKKITGVDQRYGKSIPASFGPRIQVQGTKQKEVSKKLELKAKTSDIGTTHLQSKAMVEKGVQMKKPSNSIYSKPKLSSSYNQGRGFFRGSVPTEDAKI